MEDKFSMAMVDRIDKLNESVLDEAVIIEEYSGFGNSGEQVTSVAKIKDHKNKRMFRDDTMESDDIGVIANQGMMGELATLVLLLTRPRIRYEQTLYSKVGGVMGRR